MNLKKDMGFLRYVENSFYLRGCGARTLFMRDNTNSVDNYLVELTGPLDAAMGRVEEQLRKDDLFGINIGVTEGVILSFLVKAFKVRSILEIGTQYGYSTLWLLKNLPSQGTLVSIEKDPKHFSQSQENIKDPRCTLIHGDAKAILLENLKSSKFDLIFIDANKKAYPEYLKYAKEHINEGGLIIGDNTFMLNSVFKETTGSKVDKSLTEAMRLFNREIFSDSRFTSCILPTTEGLTVALYSSN
jgi:predicted O-methyltransferase YrrM